MDRPSNETAGVQTLITTVLGEIAHSRSGDKGSSANIGVIAFTTDGFAFLQQWLTAERVEEYFRPLGVSAVTRYELLNLEAFNFLLPGVLAGGGSRSLRIDAQGKALGQAILEMPLEISSEILAVARRQHSGSAVSVVEGEQP